MDDLKQSTTDLWFSAYLKYKGYELVDYELVKRGKAIYTFGIGENDYKLRKLEFFNHDISKIKQIVEELKDLGY